MNCPGCGCEAPPDACRCAHCGAGLTGEAASDAAEAADPAELRATIQSLQAQLAGLTRRIYALENAAAAPPAQGQQPRGEPASREGSTVASSRGGGAAGSPPAPARSAAAPPPSGSSRSDWPGLSAWNWEWLIGGNWMARIGVLALIIGVGFFLKLAFDNDWIGETGRVVLGLAAGLALLGGGEYWVRKYPVWAQAVTGGGIAILYLSVFAAFVLYGLMPAWAALAFAGLVTLSAAGLALRYEARVIAVLGILGGFATPLFLADKLPAQWALLVYVLVLDLGVLALATFRNWRWFTLLALVGSLALFLFWYAELEPATPLAQVGITLIFLIFVGATTLFHLIWRRRPNPLDQGLITLNGLAYFGVSYMLMFDEYRVWMGGFTLLLALFYGLLGYGILARFREQAQLSLFALGLALVFLTVAVPVEFDGPWVSAAWAAQGVVLVWLSFIQGMRQLRWAGIAILTLLIFWLVFYDPTYLPGAGRDSDFRVNWPVVNWYFFPFAAAVVALYMAAYCWWRWQERLAYSWERQLVPVLLVAANVLTLSALSVEIMESVYPGFPGLTPEARDNIISLGLSVFWALYAAILIVLGIVLRNRWLRLGGLGLLAVPVVKLFAYDAFEMDQVYRVAAFVGLGGLLVIGGFLYQRHSRAIRGFLLE